MICQKCGREYEGESCPNCEKINQKVKSIFVDEDEELAGYIGSTTLLKYVFTGILGDGFAVLSQKRLYFKGRCYIHEGKSLKKKVTEKIVTLNDITETGIIHTQNLFAKILYVFFAVLLSIVLYSWFFWIVYFVTKKRWAKITALALPLGIPLLFYIFYKASNYSMFEVSFAGGGMGLDMEYLTVDDINRFQKLLQSLKEKAKAENHTKISDDTKTDFSEQLRKIKQLLDDGIITQADFETKKNQLLDLK